MAYPLSDDILASCSADYADVRVLQRHATTIRAIHGEIATVIEEALEGVGVRALLDGSWGFSCSDDLDAASQTITRAVQAAATLGQGNIVLATPPRHRACIPRPAVARPPDIVPLAEKVALVRRYTDLCAHPVHDTTIVTYQDLVETRTFFNTAGSAILEERALVVVSIEVIRQQGDRLIHVVEELGGSGEYHSVVDDGPVAVERLLRRAERLSSAAPLEPGVYDVVCDPAATGLLCHEVVGHLLEADVVASNLELRLRLRLTVPLAGESLTVIDDPTLPGEGRYTYDDEGVPGRRTTLLADGRVAGYLHSLQTAALFDMEPTGHGRAFDHTRPPLVRMSNTMVLPGTATPEELIADVRSGILACGTRGAVGGRFFALEPQEAWYIRNGRVCEPVTGVRIGGNTFTTLRTIDAVSSDAKLFSGGIGGCFKGDQGPLRTASGGPHLRMREVQLG
jgi:TldD protein